MERVSTAALDPHFKFEIAAYPGADKIVRCFACGTCTAGCPVFQVEAGYNPRRIVRMILLGMRDEVLNLKELWLCTRCYTCSANCPQGVDFSSIVATLRDIAVREGRAGADLPERVQGITTAAHRLRREAIRALLDEDHGSTEAIRGCVELLLQAVEAPAADAAPTRGPEGQGSSDT